MAEKEVLLEVKNLTKYFTVEKNLLGKATSVLKAVDDVSFQIYKGECLGLVGESGCGKSTIGKMLVNLYQPTSGQIIFEGKDLTALKEKERRAYCRDIQLIFQDPYASLNPRMTVGDIIAEPIIINNLLPKDQVEKRVNYLLNCVGLANHQRNRYPHEFSGGQRQRIGIARALAVNPKLIVCDEPVSALDVSIQAQIVNLMQDLREEEGISYLFIAHDISIVRYISDRIGVMYLGHLMEEAETNELFSNPLHPYTQALLSAVPHANPHVTKERIQLKGELPSPIDPPAGCVFHTRCPYATELCSRKVPKMQEITPGHRAACLLHEKESEEA